MGFPGGSVVKKPLATEETQEMWDSISGQGTSPGGGNGQSCILAWEIPWTEKPGGLQSVGVLKSWMLLTTHACMLAFTLADKYKNFYNVLGFSLNTFTFSECSSHHCLF